MTLRDVVLEALKAGNGVWVSGETLSESLGVSRTAIWKQIKALQADGCQIDSSPKKGYRLLAPADILSPSEVLPGLKTKKFGRTNYLHFQEIDSTNRKARELAIQGYPEGTVITADTQTAGRGRRGRSWYSPAQRGLYVSLILRPRLRLREVSRISLMAAVALAETLEEELALEPRIKWPNDLLINNRKIAGILSEIVTDMDSVEYIILGIGVNLNMQDKELDQDFRTVATSALMERSQPASRLIVLQSLLQHLETRYLHLSAGDFADTLKKARELSMVLGQEVELDNGGEQLTGRAFDIDDSGFLLVRDKAGAVHTVMSGEIQLL